MPNTAIKVQNVSKVYKLYDKPIDRLKESLSLTKKKYHKDFYALNDVSFEIKKGETVGIIGKNGAGKSTLLKIITGVLTPTSGHVHVNGRIASLLELGAGFNPEYTGIENIYLQGTLMGYSREEMESKVDEILAFADIGDFVYQPVKMYSSGMFARLAFAVAINVDPDILIVDEALSVGDMAFQEKCILRMKNLVCQDKTILFVSHSIPSVRNFCTRAAWFDSGTMKDIGEAHLVCELYQQDIKKLNSKNITTLNTIATDGKKNKSIAITDVSLEKDIFYTNENIKLIVGLEFNKHTIDYSVGILIYNENGELSTLFSSARDSLHFIKEYNKLEVNVPSNDFLDGQYFISVSISDSQSMFSYDKEDYIATFTIKTPKSKTNLPIAEGGFRCKHTWGHFIVRGEHEIIYKELPTGRHFSLLAILRVRNEELILKDTIEHLLTFADGIIAYDDCSNDQTADILMNDENVLAVIRNSSWSSSHQDRVAANTISRGMLLDLVSEYDTEWIFCADADERYIGNIKKFIRSDVSKNIDVVRLRLFDAYITRDDQDAYVGGLPLLDFRQFFGPERRDIIMLWRKSINAQYNTTGQREPYIEIDNEKIASLFYVQHYGKSLSIEHWEETCDFYYKYFPYDTFGKKWLERKGRAIHEKSDFDASLYKWGEELFKNAIKIN